MSRKFSCHAVGDDDTKKKSSPSNAVLIGVELMAQKS